MWQPELTHTLYEHMYNYRKLDKNLKRVTEHFSLRIHKLCLHWKADDDSIVYNNNTLFPCLLVI